MPAPNRYGYAFALNLPPDQDGLLRDWAAATPGATWDEAGSHVTLARLTGDMGPEDLLPAIRDACAGVRALDLAFTLPSRESYWDKPGLEIVMLASDNDDAVAGVLDLRERLLASMRPLGLALAEAGPYRPHITLTTGLPSADADRLEAAARALDVRFSARELVYWFGGETGDADTPADPPWRIVHRLQLR